MEYLKIIEENFTKSDYVAYLRGSIIMWLLEDKPLDIQQFKLYANKLVEAMEEQPSEKLAETQQIESFDYTKEQLVETPTVKQSTVDPDEPRVYKFKIGDHVLISKGTDDERTGVIIRLPRDGFTIDSSNYLVELDDKDLGWEATVEGEGVSCKNAWYAHELNMELLSEKPNSILEKDKWYHTTDFTVEKLTELLPKGTTVVVEDKAWYRGIETEPPTNTTTVVVHSITTPVFGEQALIETTQGAFMKEWFKLAEEQ